MSPLIEQAVTHWPFVAPLVTAPVSEADYDGLVERLDEILSITGGDQDHALATLASVIGSLIEAYDERVRPMPAVSGANALRHLMKEHCLAPDDLCDVAEPSEISDMVTGNREIEVPHARALARRSLFRQRSSYRFDMVR